MELVFVIGILIGVIVGLLYPHKSSGVLRIDHSNPEKDIYRFEINDLDYLNKKKKKKIVLKIDHNANLSQD